MNEPDALTDEAMRNRMLDLSYCLYECLADFLDEATLFDSCDDDIDYAIHRGRAAMAAVKCITDMDMLRPLLDSLVPNP